MDGGASTMFSSQTPHTQYLDTLPFDGALDLGLGLGFGLAIGWLEVGTVCFFVAVGGVAIILDSSLVTILGGVAGTVTYLGTRAPLVMPLDSIGVATLVLNLHVESEVDRKAGL